MHNIAIFVNVKLNKAGFMSKLIEDFDFGEEFSAEDIVPSFGEIPDEDYEEESSVIKKENQPDPSKKGIVEVDDLLNYNEEKHKTAHFRYEWGDESFDEEEQRLQDGFKDFLNMPRISGLKKSFWDANKIPADRVARSKKSIEIKDMPEIDIESDDVNNLNYSTVLIHKNDSDEITSIDVICTCGNHTKLKFDYDSDGKKEIVFKSKVIVKDSSKDPTVFSTDISNRIMESPDNFEDDNSYENDLYNMIDNFSDLSFQELDDE